MKKDRRRKRPAAGPPVRNSVTIAKNTGGARGKGGEIPQRPVKLAGVEKGKERTVSWRGEGGGDAAQEGVALIAPEDLTEQKKPFRPRGNPEQERIKRFSKADVRIKTAETFLCKLRMSSIAGPGGQKSTDTFQKEEDQPAQSFPTRATGGRALIVRAEKKKTERLGRHNVVHPTTCLNKFGNLFPEKKRDQPSREGRKSPRIRRNRVFEPPDVQEHFGENGIDLLRMIQPPRS